MVSRALVHDRSDQHHLWGVMRRISVIGASGTGKSNFTRALGDRLDLPIVHLDREFWRPGWIEPEREAWRARVAELAAAEAWIMDGNYSATWDLRMPRSQVVIWLDLPRRVYFPRAVWRSLKGLGRTRPDMADGCPEQIDLKFLLDWVWGYPARSHARTAARLEAMRADKRIVILRSRSDVATFLGGLPETLSRGS